MARHNDRNGVSPVGLAHGARRGRRADALGELTITDRRAKRDSHQLLPDALLERCAG
jgi:hypothetical protein